MQLSAEGVVADEVLALPEVASNLDFQAREEVVDDTDFAAQVQGLFKSLQVALIAISARSAAKSILGQIICRRMASTDSISSRTFWHSAAHGSFRNYHGQPPNSMFSH